MFAEMSMRKHQVFNWTSQRDSVVEAAAAASLEKTAELALSLCMLQLFLGTLREAEVERVNQRISQAIIETCLAMTIFRDEFNVKFVALFTVLSFIKIFHWLVQDRCALYCLSIIRHGCM